MQTRAAKQLLSQSQEGIGSIVNRIKASPLSFQAHSPVSKKHAAVLVPIFEGPDGVVRVVLTRRTTSLSTHAGEVALPGGKRDETDIDDVHTALREAREELGIQEVEVLGKLKPFLSKHFLSVTPVIGRIDPVTKFQLNRAEAFGDEICYRLHFFQHGEFTIWGLTAGILIEAAAFALGREPEFQTMPKGKGKYTDIIYDGEKIVLRDGSKI